MKKAVLNELGERLIQELHRGVVVLAALSRLREPRYGYDLISLLAGQGLPVEQGTLYPLLRRLESQGLLQSEWNVEGSRPRRYYQLSPAGVEMLAALTHEWHTLTRVMAVILDEEDKGDT